ncbi:MAG TPA: amidohydrolase family protein [Candidatus Kapabacteria bacterium]|nr:amidohydrolase family protein [Candidatus Kapabacteria bacterium]
MQCFQGQIELKSSKILSLKNQAGIVKILSNGKIIEYKNCWAFPGFVDHHCHLLALGTRQMQINLFGLKSLKECLNVVKSKIRNQNDWIRGWGWNQELWNNKDFPTKNVLDEIFPNSPVYLSRVDGHAAWVNSAALKIANITKDTPNLKGGAILKDEKGEPNGILIDNAMQLVKHLIPELSYLQKKKAVSIAISELVKSGITQIRNMDLSLEQFNLLEELENEGSLPIKVNSYLIAQEDEYLQYNIIPNKNERKMHHVVGIKLYADGALGSRGAALLEDYSDEQNQKGLLLLSDEELYTKAITGLDKGLDIAIHSIGDAACRQVLQLFKRLFDEKRVGTNQELSIEHAQNLMQEDMHFFSEYPITASVQPVHCTSDAPMALKRLGARCKNAYRWKSIISKGANFCSGSDFPIESHSVLLGLDALTRRVPFNQNVAFYPDEIISIEEAIKSYTSEQDSNPFEPGKNADFVILNQNITNIPLENIKETEIVATVCNGNLVYSSK